MTSFTGVFGQHINLSLRCKLLLYFVVLFSPNKVDHTRQPVSWKFELKLELGTKLEVETKLQVGTKLQVETKLEI